MLAPLPFLAPLRSSARRARAVVVLLSVGCLVEWGLAVADVRTYLAAAARAPHSMLGELFVPSAPSRHLVRLGIVLAGIALVELWAVAARRTIRSMLGPNAIEDDGLGALSVASDPRHLPAVERRAVDESAGYRTQAAPLVPATRAWPTWLPTAAFAFACVASAISPFAFVVLPTSPMLAGALFNTASPLAALAVGLAAKTVYGIQRRLQVLAERATAAAEWEG